MGANFITRALGFVDVSEDEKEITIGGIKAEALGKDIMRVWGTNRIEKWMFSEIGGRVIKFPKFFAPEVHYILGKVKEIKNANTSKGGLSDALRLLEQNTWLNRLTKEYPSIYDESRINEFHKRPMPHQVNFMKAYSYRVQAYGLLGYLLSAGAGTGKAQPLSAKVKVQHGWKTMAEIQIGDYVTAWDGTQTRVTGVFPQGEREVYSLTFADGRKVRADGEHLWRVYNNRRRPHLQEKIATTLEVIEMLKNGDRVHVDLCVSEECPDIELPVHPYLLGAILGDGSISQDFITISKGDEEFFQHVADALPEGVKLSRRDEITYGIISSDGRKNILVDELRSLKLMGKTSDLKWIPEVYFGGSTEQRLELLRGLLDTDGTVDKKTATPSFSTTSKILARDVQRLVWSLGGYAKISNKQTYYTYNGEKKAGKPSYVVTIRIKEPSRLFKLSRKRELTNDNNQYAKNLKLGVLAIEFNGTEYCQCISVEHPEHLYVTDNYVVTHNTLTSLMQAEMIRPDYVVIVSPKNAVYRVWAKTLQEEYVKPRPAWIVADNKDYKGQRYIVCHYEGLEKLAQITSKLNGKVLVILDESHNLNNDVSLRTQFFIDICRKIQAMHVLWMSGTPVKALGFESIPLLRTIDPLFTPDVELRFRKMYGRDATKALDVLRQRMGMVSFHVESSAVVTNESKTHTKMVKIPNGKAYTLDTVQTEMRAFIDQRLKYYLGERKKYRRIYEDALDIYEDTIKTSEDKRAFKIYKHYVDMISDGFDPKAMASEAKYCNNFEKNVIAPTLPRELKKQFMSAKSVVKYPQLKVLGEALGGVLGKKRVQCHLDMIPHMGLPEIIQSASKKTIIFTSYVPVADAIAKYLTSQGFDPVVVHAQLGEDLTSQVSLFEKKPTKNPLVATFQSLSTAVPLTMANCTVFTNMPFREYEITQARARTNRLGQDTPVDYYNVYLDTGKESNVSTRSRDILEWSRQQVAAILGQDYAGTITADMVNALESYAEDTLPPEVKVTNVPLAVSMEQFCEMYE